MNERLVRLGREIKAARCNARMTQQMLADRINVGLRTLQQWEAGTRRVQLEALEKIAAVLGIHVIQLIDPTGSVVPDSRDRYRARIEAKIDELIRRLPPSK